MSPFGRRQPESPPSRDRSPEERERARLEREARRAAREGRPAPTTPPPDLHDDEPVDVPAPEPVAEAPFVAPPAEEVPVEQPTEAFVAPAIDNPTVEFDVVADQQASPEPEPEPAPAPEVREPDPEPPPPPSPGDPTFSRWGSTGMTEDQPAVRPAAPPVVPAPAARSPRFGDEDERPVAPKRVSRRTLPPPPPPPGEKPPRRGRGRKGRLFGVLALLLIAGAAWLTLTLFQPFKGDGGDPVTVRVPTDSTADEIGDILAEKGVVDSAFVFTLRARLGGASLQAGTYRMKEDSSYADAIDQLEAGPAAPKVVRLTLPEGRTRRENQPLIRDAGIEGSYLQASEKPTADFNPRRYGAPRNLASLEGFLFPATYELRPGSTSRRLVAQQLDAFRENIRDVSMRRARARNLTTYEVLIIASMIEREASLAKERRLISAVIHNRLREGMPLGIDATIRFATRNWSRPLKVSELNIDSPYNTRRRTGLPPGPIGSPGLASIKAAANPANVDYLYYVVKPSGDGAHNFSSTDAEFQKDVEAYNREQERRGGESPAPSE